MQKFNVASIIIASSTNNQPNWNQTKNSQNLLEIALQRHRLAATKTYILTPSLTMQNEIIATFQGSDLLKGVNFIIQHTDLPNFNSEMLSILSICRELKDIENLILVDDIRYSGINSLDLLRLYQQLKDNPMELITYLKPDGSLTSTLFGCDLSLTTRRLKDTIKLADNRIGSFYRSSLNTGIIPITSTSHHFEDYCDPSSDEETQFGEPFIVRPGKSYQAAKQMTNRSMNPHQVEQLYTKEKVSWNEVSSIQEDIEKDIVKFRS